MDDTAEATWRPDVPSSAYSGQERASVVAAADVAAVQALLGRTPMLCWQVSRET